MLVLTLLMACGSPMDPGVVSVPLTEPWTGEGLVLDGFDVVACRPAALHLGADEGEAEATHDAFVENLARSGWQADHQATDEFLATSRLRRGEETLHLAVRREAGQTRVSLALRPDPPAAAPPSTEPAP